ncbi:hypothetical protein DFJ74DRAFT_708002 [Hyaloraphidium curvatum]|nr:hypothetical protein DFJ74DRAFT_708002 [Hyaloraphidium curvatum]
MAAFSSSLRLALAALAALALARAAPASAAVYLSTAAFERPNCQGNATTVVTTPNPAASCADLPQASLDRCVPVNGTFGAVFCGTEFIAKPPPTSSGTYARGTLFTDATCTNASVQIAVQDLRCESLAPFGVAVYGRPECQPSGLAVLTVFSDVLCTQPFGLSVNLTESTCSPQQHHRDGHEHGDYGHADEQARGGREEDRGMVGRVRPAASQGLDYTAPRPPLLYANESSRFYSGIAQVDGLGLTCTGWLVAVGSPNDRATMLTAGHCTRALDAVTVYEDVPPKDNATAIFLRYIDSPGEFTVAVDRVLWGSMRHQDVTVLRLAATNAELAAKGLRLYNLSGDVSLGGTVRTAGLPARGDPRVLRETVCTAGPMARINEWSWIWNEARRIGGPECGGVLPGSSGSPLFNAAGQAVGVVSTTTIGAEFWSACGNGNPCELVSGNSSQSYLPNTTYAMEIAPLLPCFAGGRFDRAAEGCPLEAPSMAAKVSGIEEVQNITVWYVPAAIDSTDVQQMAWKHGFLSSTDCLSPDGYNTTLPVGERYNTTLTPDVEVRWVACAAPVVSGSPAPGSAGHKIIKIDRTPPVIPVRASITQAADGTARVEPIQESPELENFEEKHGPANSTDCRDPAGFRSTFRQPFPVKASEMPAVVCLRGSDVAGNVGGVTQYNLTLNGTTTTTTRPSGAGKASVGAGWIAFAVLLAAIM